MNNKKKISAIILLFSFLSQYSIAQSYKDVTLSNKLSILNDRVYLQFPLNSVITSRDTTNNYSTYIRVIFNNVIIRFSARDIFKTATNKLFASLAKETTLLDYKKLLATKEEQQLQALLITPFKYDTVLRSVLINKLLVKTKDNSLIEIDVSIQAKDFLQKDEVTKLSEQIFQTITNGTRLINLNARKEIRKVAGTQKNFVFNLPENYVLKDESNLFNVKLIIVKYKDFTYNDYNILNRDEFIFNISKDSYIDFEDFTYWGYEQSSGKLNKVEIKGKFLSEKIEWLTFDLFRQGLFLKEQIIECKQLGRNCVVHISMISDNQKNIKEMTKIAEAIELE